jgi:decaprenylphospho-beta-D-ribofuranose 2-oxidase
MSPADTTLEFEAATLRPATVTVRGWGGGAGAPVRLLRPDGVDGLRAAVGQWRAPGDGAIARGMGRSYGDAAQLAGGLVLDTTRCKRFALDQQRGTVTADAGVTLGELLESLVPAGWMVPVLPGTQHVTVGGAIASDIHGKNHATAGTFGSHVSAMALLTAAGEVLELTPEHDVFAATLGGMGLTGVILEATIKCRPVNGPLLSVDTDRVEDLGEALEALSAPGGPHRVAWLDLLCARPGRGIVTRAEHADAAAAPDTARGVGATVASRATVPRGWPAGLLRPSTVRAFNELYFRLAPRRRRGHIEGIGPHMFPLDALDAWPRLYGPRGFLQYQLVVPTGQEEVLQTVIDRLRPARIPCYLAVLKDFGPANDAPLSFPLAGWTMTLDMPRAAAGLESLLDGFDELVAGAGGRVYLSKDVRMRPEALEAMYPRLQEWRSIRDRVDPERRWRSDLARRTGLLDGEGRGRRPGERLRALPDERGASASAEKRVLLLGGSSEIGLAIVRRLVADGPVRAFLLGRDPERLASAAAALERAGSSGAQFELIDAGDAPSRHAEVIGAAFDRMGGFDLAVLAIGVLGAQAGLDADPAKAAEVMQVNFAGSGSMMLECLRRFRDQGRGTLVVLSTVAGERVRASNAIYGAAKAGLDALAQGLADAAAGTGVRVLVVRPGFVKTRMTADLDPAPMATTAEAVAEATVRALDGNAHTVWVPARLRVIFAVLRHLPRPIFRRLPL